MIEQLTKYRRELHKIPELDKDLPLTFKYINERLQNFNCEMIYPDVNAICAFFDFGAPNTIAYRSDMDALPIREKNTHDFISTHDGKMHACGHDGHMAILLSFAEYIDNLGTAPNYNVMLIFQTAEESIGGAKDICNSGIFEKYSIFRTYGCHLWPELPIGTIGARAGEMMAQSNEVTVRITGKSSHIAKHQLGSDAMIAGARFLLSAYEMEAKEIDSNIFRLLKFGKMHSGTVRNAISASTTFEGSMRVFEDITFQYINRRLIEIGKSIETETNCKFDIKVSNGYPPLINDKELFDKVFKIYPDDILLIKEPSLTAEDFSVYGTKSSIFFFFLGIGVNIPLHSDTFDFDEKALEYGLDFYKKLLYV